MFIGGFLFLVFVIAVGIAGLVFDLPRPFFVHGVFALAALPLMWAAILHFVPVLTRSGSPGRGLRALPWIASGLAGLLLAVLTGVLPRAALPVVAVLFGTSAFVMLSWVVRRARNAVGSPHPGVRWYVASLGFLILGFGAAAAMVLDPQRLSLWHGLHQHLNLFGWVGLTVLGTLPVLLPTCLQRFEPRATLRLELGLPWAFLGVLALAGAAALHLPELGAFAGLILMLVLAAHLRAWLNFYGPPWRWPGPGISLLLGACFLLLLLLVGIAHGFGALAGATLLPAFAAGFLLPIVLGALAQLLPVWRFPGPGSAPREKFAQALAKHAGLRGGLCVVAGAGQLFGLTPMLLLVLIAVLWLLLAVLWALRPQTPRSTAPL